MTQPTQTLPKLELGNWSPEKRQQWAARTEASHWFTVMGFLSKKYGMDAVREYMSWNAKAMAKLLKTEGVKTPLDLARHLGEHDWNVSGTKLEVRGDKSQAEIYCANCSVGSAFGKLAEAAGMNPDAVCGAGSQGSKHEHEGGPLAWFRSVAEEFGFKFEGEMNPPTGYRVLFRA